MSEGVLRVLLAKFTNNEILDSSKGNNPLLLYFFPPSLDPPILHNLSDSLHSFNFSEYPFHPILHLTDWLSNYVLLCQVMLDTDWIYHRQTVFVSCKLCLKASNLFSYFRWLLPTRQHYSWYRNIPNSFPLLTKDIPRFVNFGNNSWKPFQSGQIRALTAPAHPSDRPITSPRKQNVGRVSNSSSLAILGLQFYLIFPLYYNTFLPIFTGWYKYSDTC